MTRLPPSIFDWDELIKLVCERLSELTGNVLGAKQRPMVESRLKRRLLDLKISSPSDYHDYWMHNQQAEDTYLVGLLTTHFTSFFREYSHFEWLASELPQMVAHARAEGRSVMKFWSAACSKGQEVWSLCMWLHHHLPKIDATMKWEVLGSDIDANSIREGQNGVYHRRELETAPRHLWEGLWIRGKDEISDWYKVKPELQSHVRFKVINLLSLDLPKNEKFDAILCRNVLIYFDRTNQQKIADSLLSFLVPQGALITGMSESLNGFGMDIKCVSSSVYKNITSDRTNVIPLNTKVAVAPVVAPSPLRVLCVDDSSTVLTILKKVLSAPHFEVVGTAKDGREATEKLKTLKPDVITLDLHMPEMDGPTFLQTTGVASKLPVVIVSSVGRDDSAMVEPLFKLGVIDFVEKPTLQNIDKIGDELTQKLKAGWIAKNNNIKTTTSQQVVENKKRNQSHIIFNIGLSDEANLIKVLKERSWRGDDITILVTATASMEIYLANLVRPLLKEAKSVQVCHNPGQLRHNPHPSCWLHFKQGNPNFLNEQRKVVDIVLVEDSQNVSHQFQESADDVAPVTSFTYLVDKLLGVA